jgi:hypothetical protein
MYWQVYLHKTVLAAEYLLVKILQRAKKLAEQGHELFATPALKEFLYNKYHKKDFETKPHLLDTFSKLDDFDIYTSVKVWCDNNDPVLSLLCRNMVNRHLFHIELQNEVFKENFIEKMRKQTIQNLNISKEDCEYFVFTDKVENNAYNPQSVKINILFKDGSIKDITDASDQLNISVLSRTVTKYFLCYPKELKNTVNKR